MAYDGLMAAAVLCEIRSQLLTSKIEKITQPETDRIVMQIRTAAGRKKLMLDVSSSGARVQLTELEFENPDVAPAFCMLLRKHIQGGRIIDVRQRGRERITELDIETVNEMGYSVNKRLIAETMGKHSNLVLTDAQTGKIIDSIKRISIDVNRVRQILPGIVYEYPPVSNLSNQEGYGPTTAAAIEVGAILPELNEGNSFSCYVYTDKDGSPKDFHVFRMPQYLDRYDEKVFDSACLGMDWFYSHKVSTDRNSQRSAEMVRTTGNLIQKAQLKKQRLLEEIKKADDADIYRLKGELLNANLHLAAPGAKSVKVISYYDGTELTIELDEKLSASKNAQNFYKKYAKLKSSKKEKLAQLAECEKDMEYLSSVQAMAASARTSDELERLRDELSDQGYIRARSAAAKKKKAKPAPRRFRLPSGLTVLVGRNNTENDFITFLTPDESRMWDDPAPQEMYDAASRAAWFSKARDSQNGPVDYAPARPVKKPAGARPGMVIFTNNGTVWIDPKDPDTAFENISK